MKTDCSSCVIRNYCKVGLSVDAGVNPPSTLTEKLEDPFFKPVDLYEPVQTPLIDYSGMIDVSSLFCEELREFILNNILSNRPDPYNGTPNMSTENYPIYIDDMEKITESREPIHIVLNSSNTIGCYGIEYITMTPEIHITTNVQSSLDLRYNKNLRRLNIHSTSIKSLYLPNMLEHEDYVSTPLDDIVLNIPNLNILNMSTMKKTYAGWNNINDAENMSMLLFLYIPNQCYNQRFNLINMENITNNTDINYLRIEFKVIFEDNKYRCYLVDKSKHGFTYLREDIVDIDNELIETTSHASRFSLTNDYLEWNNLSDIPKGFMITPLIAGIIDLKEVN